MNNYFYINGFDEIVFSFLYLKKKLDTLQVYTERFKFACKNMKH